MVASALASPFATTSNNMLSSPTTYVPPPQTPIQTSLFGAREAALTDALARASTPAEAVATLDEYAWRALVAGTGVREYCGAANAAVHASLPTGIRLALVRMNTRLLYPFDVPAGAPAGEHCSPALAISSMANVSRKQLVDALVRLSRDPNHTLSEARILEIVLHYVGRRWRASEGEDVVEAVAKKLSEVELEVKVQGEQCGVRSAILPTLEQFRFQLGFVSAAQLITRLNVVPAFYGRPNKFDTDQLFSAWVVRRLSAGTEPQTLAEELQSVQDRLVVPADRAAMDRTLASFCLNGRRMGTDTPSPPPVALRTRTRTMSRLSLRSSMRKTLPISHLLLNRNGTAKLPEFDCDRRPSLPNIFTQGDSNAITPITTSPQRLSSPNPLGSPPGGSYLKAPSSYRDRSRSPSSTISVGCPCSPTPSSPQTAPASPTNMKAIRSALVDHLLVLRFRLCSDADGWHLGTGRDKAADLLNSLKGKSDMQSLITELSSAFHLSTLVAVEPIPTVGTRTPPTPIMPQPVSLHQRDVSFDLDAYIADIGPLEGDESFQSATNRAPTPPASSYPRSAPSTPSPQNYKRRASCASVMTTSSMLSSTNTLSSSLRRYSSEFAICHATRVPVLLTPVEYRLPSKGVDSTEAFTAADDTKTTLVDEPLGHLREPSRLSEASKSSRLSQASSLSVPTSLLPAFEETSAKRPSIDFPSRMAPPLSPGGQSGFSFPDIDPPLSPAPSELPYSSNHLSTRQPARSVRNRRQLFRQCVIVDGEQVSPTYGGFPPSTDGDRSSEGSPLGVILSIFNNPSKDELDPTELERVLLTAVDLEEARLAAFGEKLNCEARARLAWLLEQVSSELVHPELIAAVARVLKRLGPWGGEGNGDALLPRSRSAPNVHRQLNLHDLKIIVPMREPSNVAISTPMATAVTPSSSMVQPVRDALSNPPSPVESPCSMRTFGPLPASSVSDIASARTSMATTRSSLASLPTGPSTGPSARTSFPAQFGLGEWGNSWDLVNDDDDAPIETSWRHLSLAAAEEAGPVATDAVKTPTSRRRRIPQPLNIPPAPIGTFITHAL